MNHQQAIAASKKYFEWYKDATELHITSDGMGHDNKQYAKDHSQRLDDQTIHLVTKEQWEESEKEAAAPATGEDENAGQINITPEEVAFNEAYKELEEKEAEYEAAEPAKKGFSKIAVNKAQAKVDAAKAAMVVQA